MKTFVLIVSSVFPKEHPMARHETNFASKIKAGKKLHTIRLNYSFWRKCFDSIEKGEGILSVRKWSGVPYNSKQTVIKDFTLKDGISIQKLDSFSHSGTHAYYERDNGHVYPVLLQTLAKNDGLSLENFKAWFAAPVKNAVIIHFTPFTYNESNQVMFNEI